MKAIINYFKNAPMSKKLTVLVGLFWAMTTLFNIAFTVISRDKVLNDGMIYVHGAWFTILVSYFTKAGLENLADIKNPKQFADKIMGVTDTTTPTTPV